MTEGVKKVPLSAVEETNTSKSKETEEVDLDDFSDSNFIVRGSEQAEEVEISFSNIERESGITAEQIREELKSLKNKPIEEVTIEIDGKKGRIALEDINIGESSDKRTYHEGSISGTFLPWPKHFTDNRPKIYTFLNGLTFLSYNASGNLLFSIELEGDFVSELVLDSSLNRITALDGGVSAKNIYYDVDEGYGTNYGSAYSFENVHLSYILSLISDSSFNLDLPTSLSLIASLDGSSSYSLSSTSDLSLLHSVSSSSNYTLSSSSSLSRLIAGSGLVSLNVSMLSDLSQLQSVSSSTSYQANLNGDVGSEKAISSSLTFKNALSSTISELLSLSSNLSAVNTLTGDLQFSSVGYGSNYGSAYGSPQIYGEQYGSTYGSSAEYSATYGSNYGS